jgi:putative DNA primase/helicase
VGAWIHSSEDDPSDTIRPRLEVAGADLDRVLVTTEGSLELPEDIEAMEELVIAHDVRLIVIDPLESIISSELDAHSSKDVRQALDPLVALAIRRRVAVVGVRHLNKDVRTTNARVRGTGSLAYTAIARSEMLCGQHPEDETLRVLARVKSNIAVAYPAISYSIEAVETSIELDYGPDAAFNPPGDRIVMPRVSWGQACEIKASEVLRGQAQEGKAAKDEGEGRRVGPKTGEAEELIKAMLQEAGGSRAAGEIIARAADDGIPERTVQRAAMNLIQCEILSRNKTIVDPAGGGAGGVWVWTLIASPDEL